MSIKPTANEEAIHESYMDMVNRLMERIEDLERENMDLRQQLGMEQVMDLPTILCMMCDKGKPARKATTIIADIPACEQCAKEYQDAEDALGNEASE